MPKLTADYKINDEQLAKLKQLVPEAFKDNELDFNSLYEALSDYTPDNDDDNDIEQYGLSWPGKKKAKRAAAIPPVGTLVPVPGDGLDEETTKNIYIEGDNLEVLKIIRKAYLGRIKMIYIDPPYNTGNDFIYDDNFTESIESYQKRTGQVDESGAKMTTNTKSDGRFHSKWLSMMYPRLRLARDLLTEDGVIFISIDDNEVAQLRKLCDEIFGEENFVGNFIWKKKGTSINVANTLVSSLTDHILCYSHNQTLCLNRRKTSVEDRQYLYTDEEGKYRTTIIEKKDAGNYVRETMKFEIMGIRPREGKRWQIGEKKARELEKQKRFINDNGVIKLKIYDFEDEDSFSANPNLLLEYGSSDSANKAVNVNLFNTPELFSNPKPVELIKYLLTIGTNENDIVLDFFSGSATTAHTVMQLNAELANKADTSVSSVPLCENKKQIQYIMVQLPEICDKDSEAAKAGFANICEIGKERIRRASKKIKESSNKTNKDQPELIRENPCNPWTNSSLDLGFKVYRLAPSNYKPWTNYSGTDIKQLESLFAQDSLKPNWKEDDLLTEVMLLEGFPLDSKIELLPQFTKNKVKHISSDFCEHTLYICLDKEIKKETIEALKLSDKDRFICLDSAVDDQSKIRLEDKNLIKTL